MLNLKLARGHAGWLALVWVPEAFAAEKVDMASFPKPLTDYVATDQAGVWATLQSRISVDPFNLVATTIFLLAIVHTFFTAKFRHWAHEVEEEHKKKLEARCGDQGGGEEDEAAEVSFQGQLLHFLGEIEAVFGIWAVVLAIAITFFKGWGTTVSYLGHTVNFTEAAFVTVIMALASTRPVLRFAEQCLSGIAKIGQSTAAAWWLTILIVAPLLGSFVTEPAAMTIAALLLGQQFYVHRPSSRFRYATLGLLFVNISVGGTLTHFAAPPVLMVAAPWGWNIAYMFNHFGWKAAVGIVAATLSYYTMFRGEFVQIDAARSKRATELETKQPIPIWITLTHLGFMGFTVFVAHYQALFIGGFLFFLAFHQATAHHQGKIELKSPLLVGFFLAGLVVHGGVQGWWIEPVLRSLARVQLFIGATILTAFNDNAAITYLATLVPSFTEPLKQAVVAGAVVGGGLTVIANAPNPAGQSMLQRYFPEGISPLGLLGGAIPPTLIMATVFLIL